MPLFCLKMHTSNVSFLWHVYKSYLNVLIEPRPNSGLIYALSVKPGQHVITQTRCWSSVCTPGVPDGEQWRDVFPFTTFTSCGINRRVPEDISFNCMQKFIEW